MLRLVGKLLFNARAIPIIKTLAEAMSKLEDDPLTLFDHPDAAKVDRNPFAFPDV